MTGEPKITTDHVAIKKWAEERGGIPAQVIGTAVKGETGLLRIDFPGYGREGTLEEIPWNKFFEKFDKKKLAFLYQDETAKGKTSRFFKLIRRKE